MKKDLLHECNDMGLNVVEFESTFCNRCKNRECERAGWSTTNWDKRITTQMDRLLINPNIANQEDSSRWESISNFLPFQEVEDWKVETIISVENKNQFSSPSLSEAEVTLPPPKSDDPLQRERVGLSEVLTDNKPSVTDKGKVDLFNLEVSLSKPEEVKTKNKPVSKKTRQEVIPPAPIPPPMNTPIATSGIMIGGVEPSQPAPQVDEWGIDPKELKIGGTFKMGGE